MIRTLLVASLLLPLSACASGGRVLLTFDDDFVQQWYEHRDLLAEHDVPATFMVTRWGDLSDEEVAQLLELEQEGHELGCHGLTHENPKDYAAEHSAEEYVQDEVLPAVELMRSDGVEPSSYSYPWGGRSSELDEAIGQHFDILRDSGRITQVDRILYRADDGELAHGARIDHGYAPEDGLRELLEQARAEDAAVVLYTHRILVESEASHVKPDELVALFELVDELDLGWATLSELAP